MFNFLMCSLLSFLVFSFVLFRLLFLILSILNICFHLFQYILDEKSFWVYHFNKDSKLWLVSTQHVVEIHLIMRRKAHCFFLFERCAWWNEGVICFNHVCAVFYWYKIVFEFCSMCLSWVSWPLTSF